MHWPELKAFEHVHWREIPYHLLPDVSAYGQFDDGRIVFSMYSVLGCPYQCTFCSSPAQYRGTPGRLWVRLEVAEVVDHIAYVVETYGAGFIYFIDDDSFVGLTHVENIIDEIRRRGIKVGLGFRGARINEIKRMSDAYLEKLVDAGTEIMHVGVESGSDRILALIKKDCTVEDILACNRKLARHPRLTVGYNFMIGIPSETLDELHATRDLWLKLLADNPRAIIFTPNRFRPLPGTEMFEDACRDYDYRPPQTLQDWAEVELERDVRFPWYPDGMAEFCDLLFITSYLVDDKIFRFSQGDAPLYRLLRAAATVYGPVARFRLRHGIDKWLVEHHAYRLLSRAMLALQSANHPLWRRATTRTRRARAAV
ncbi:MAG: radical SAM protein [Polyangiales bacterium]